MSSLTISLLSLRPRCRIQSDIEFEFLAVDLEIGSGYIPLIAGLSGILARNVSKAVLKLFREPVKFLISAGRRLKIPPPCTAKEDSLMFLAVVQCLVLIPGMVTILPLLWLSVQFMLHCGTKPFITFQI